MSSLVQTPRAGGFEAAAAAAAAAAATVARSRRESEDIAGAQLPRSTRWTDRLGLTHVKGLSVAPESCDDVLEVLSALRSDCDSPRVRLDVIAALQSWKTQLNPSEEDIQQLYVNLYAACNQVNHVYNLWSMLIEANWILGNPDSEALAVRDHIFAPHRAYPTLIDGVWELGRQRAPAVARYIQSIAKTILSFTGIDPELFARASSYWDIQQRVSGVQALFMQLAIFGFLMTQIWVVVPKGLELVGMHAPLWAQVATSTFLSACLVSGVAIIFFLSYRLAVGVPLVLNPCTNLTQEARTSTMDPAIEREEEVQQIITHFAGGSIGNPLWISGKNGVGKTALIREVARRVARGDAKQLNGSQIYLLNVSDLNKKDSYGSAEERLKEVFNSLGRHRGKVILAIDEAHLLLQGDIFNALKPALESLKVILITDRSFQQCTEQVSDRAFWSRISTRIELAPFETDQVVNILRDYLRRRYPQQRISEEALRHLIARTESDEFGQPRRALAELERFARYHQEGARELPPLRSLQSELRNLNECIVQEIREGLPRPGLPLLAQRVAQLQQQVAALKEIQNYINLQQEELNKRDTLRRRVSQRLTDEARAARVSQIHFHMFAQLLPQARQKDLESVSRPPRAVPETLRDYPSSLGSYLDSDFEKMQAFLNRHLPLGDVAEEDALVAHGGAADGDLRV